MFSWFIGYKNPCDEEEVKTEEVKTEDKTAVIEGKKDTVIFWRDYEIEIQKIKEELRQLKIETDKKWAERLSPVSDNTELQTKKKRKKNKSASDIPK